MAPENTYEKSNRDIDNNLIINLLDDLGFPCIGEAQEISGGLMAKILRVPSTEGSVIAKVYRKKTDSEILTMIHDISQASSTVIDYLATGKIGEFTVDVMPECKGKQIEQGNFTPDIARKIGEALAFFHKETEKVSVPARRTGFKWGLPENKELLDRWNQTTEVVLHNDLNEKNIFYDFANDKVTFIDPDNARYGTLLVDLGRIGRTLFLVPSNESYVLDKNIAHHFISGYHSIKPLTQEEINLIPSAIEITCKNLAKWYAQFAGVENDPHGSNEYQQHVKELHNAILQFNSNNSKPLLDLSLENETHLSDVARHQVHKRSNSQNLVN